MKAKVWFRIILAAAASLLVAAFVLSQALHHGWGRRYLLARLSASFGRPVEARAFGFSVLGGPSLEADAVTVAEDPRFGNEYFLRADQLTATLHWSALFRGRVELGTISFSHPSLNLVRAADGHWNIESWLPPAPAQPAASAGQEGAAQPAASSPMTQRLLRHIVVDGGRINFKLGEEKILFALADVSGHVDQDRAGRWSLDLDADPLRASVALQESGTLRVRGTVAGTSARLRPASLNVTWEDASLADALRLAGGQDYGVRGMIGAEIQAQLTEPRTLGPEAGSSPSQWQVSGKFHLAGIHRWDLTARDSDPGLNVIFSAAVQPESAQVSITNCLVETNQSRLSAMADANWSRGFVPSVQVSGSRIDLEDVLVWTRAFRANVPDGLSAEGTVDFRAAMHGWPLRLEQTNLSGTAAVVHLPGLGGPIRVGPLSASLQNESLVLTPLSVSLPGAAPPARARNGTALEAAALASAGALRVEASLGPLLAARTPADWPYRIAVSGRTSRVQDLAALAQLLGHPIANNSADDWKVQGPASLQMAWVGTARRATLAPSGALDLRGVQITGAVLNQPLRVAAAHVDFRPGERHVKLAAAQALGTSWKGTLDWYAADPVWRFDLAANRLDAADLDRWLGPRVRAGFFARIFAGHGSGGERDAAINHFAARGQLHVAALLLEPLELQRIEASVDWKGRDLALRRAKAELSDGRVVGDFEAQLTSDPAYSFHGQFERLNLAEVTASDDLPEGRVAGLASGDLDISAHGVGREALIASLSARGDVHVRAPIFRVPLVRDFDLASASLNAADARNSGETRFRAADASARMAAGIVHVEHLSLAGRDKNLEAQGSVDLTRHLDLRVWSTPRGAELVADSDPPAERTSERASPDRQEWTIGGTLDAPLITVKSPSAGDVAASAPVLSPIPSALPAPSFSPPPARR